jgi:hypothetical protein
MLIMTSDDCSCGPAPGRSEESWMTGMLITG